MVIRSKNIKNIKIEMPSEVKLVIELLEKNGYKAHIVGGCVRDYLLDKTPCDWDIATNAKPYEVKNIFNNTIDTGIKHGTVIVRIRGKSYEVTTYRIDSIYSDCRHPDYIKFSQDLREDLLRRDFTINAMAYNQSDGIVDLYGGIDDLNNNIIKCVGNPLERFNEDALRMLRAIRFSAVLGFNIEYKTCCAIKSLKEKIKLISSERIQTELIKILLSDNPEKLAVADEYGLMDFIVQEYSYYNDCYKIKILNSIKAAPKDIIIRFALLLSGIDLNFKLDDDLKNIYRTSFNQESLKNKIKKIMLGLRFDNYTLRSVTKLILMKNLELTDDFVKIRYQISKVGIKFYEKYLKFRAYLLNNNEKKMFARQVKCFYDICDKADAVCVKDLRIVGSDLINIGFKQGKEIGDTLEQLLKVVLEKPELNTLEKLIEIAKSIYNDSARYYCND